VANLDRSRQMLGDVGITEPAHVDMFTAIIAGIADALLATFEDEISVTIQSLRELAHGIYPALLAAEGIPAALRAAAARSPFAVEVVAHDVGRHDEEIEAAVYFCCLEALQNIAKSASATAATVAISVDERSLSFTVSDDGCGFDVASTPRGAGTVNMADRLAALGGQLSIDSVPGRGTAVVGRIPARAPSS
jgi:signal transduction histidine kinase